jgi:hypothetical protein
MKTQYIKRKNKIYRLLIKNKFYKKSKKDMKMIWQTIIRIIIKIKKRVPSLKMMEATIVKVDSEKEAKNRTKDYRNYRIMKENKICTMNPMNMIEMLKIIISIIENIPTLIIEMSRIIKENLSNLLKTITI